MYGGRTRTTVTLQYGEGDDLEQRDLRITFDLIDKIRSKVPWEKLAIGLAQDEPDINFSMLAKFVYLNLEAAGFKPDIDDIYDEMMSSGDNKASYMQVASEIILAYQPQGRVKKKPEVAKPKATKNKAT